MTSLQVKLVNDAGQSLYSSTCVDTLIPRAKSAGVHHLLWHPLSVPVLSADALVEPLICAVRELRASPDAYRPDLPPEGCGTLQGFIDWLLGVVIACLYNPNARIEVEQLENVG